MLNLQEITVKRGQLTVADKLSTTFNAGCVYGLLGPNGAGKSSLLKAIFGELPHGGAITFDGEKLIPRQRYHWRKRLGYMPQDNQLDVSLSALELVLLGKVSQLSMLISDEVLHEALAVMERLNITHLAEKNVTQLSGGQRQMVLFAQVLLRKPQLLLLDEPVSALDMHHQNVLLSRVHDYTHQHQIVTVMVLHDLNLAAQFCDELLLLQGATIQAQGDPKSVLQQDLIENLYDTTVGLLYDDSGLPVIFPQKGEKQGATK